MPVSSNVYFEFVYPALLLFILGLNLFRPNDERLKFRKIIIDFLNLTEPGWIYKVIGFSVVAFYLRGFLPSVLQYVCMLIFLMMFPALVLLLKKQNKTINKGFIINLVLNL